MTLLSSNKLCDKKLDQAPRMDTIDPNANISAILYIKHTSID
jgi:hypothetical protein